MKCRYVLLESMIGTRKSYGIAVVCDCDDCAVPLQTIADLCSDRAAAAALVERCNMLELSLCHLPDVIDDFLAEL